MSVVSFCNVIFDSFSLLVYNTSLCISIILLSLISCIFRFRTWGITMYFGLANCKICLVIATKSSVIKSEVSVSDIRMSKFEFTCTLLASQRIKSDLVSSPNLLTSFLQTFMVRGLYSMKVQKSAPNSNPNMPRIQVPAPASIIFTSFTISWFINIQRR